MSARCRPEMWARGVNQQMPSLSEFGQSSAEFAAMLVKAGWLPLSRRGPMLCGRRAANKWPSSTLAGDSGPLPRDTYQPPIWKLPEARFRKWGPLGSDLDERWRLRLDICCGDADLEGPKHTPQTHTKLDPCASRLSSPAPPPHAPDLIATRRRRNPRRSRPRKGMR